MGNKDDAAYIEEDKDKDTGSITGWSGRAMWQIRPEYDDGCCGDWGSWDCDELLSTLGRNPPLLGRLPLDVEELLVVTVGVAVVVVVVAAADVPTPAGFGGGGCNFAF